MSRRFILVLWVLTLGGLFFATEDELCGAEKYKNLIWGSEDIDATTAAAGSLMYLYGLDVAGANKLKLAKDAYAGDQHTVSGKGDLVELGYFTNKIAAGAGQYVPSATSADLFLGKHWVALTNTSKIGQRSYDDSGAPAQNLDGKLMLQTKFTDNNTPLGVYNTVTHNPGTGDWQEVDTVTDLQLKLAALETAGAGNAFLAMRFYDVDTATGTFDTVGGDQSDLASATKQSRYNTITSTEFLWVARDDGFAEVYTTLHDDDGTLRDLEYEMDNAFEFNSVNKLEIGTGGSNEVGDIGDNALVRTATISHRDSTALNLANTGDTIVSNLNDAFGITGDGSTARDLTVLARSTGTSYTYTGDISTGKTEIHKIGVGNQVFAGAIDTSEALFIDQGTVTLTPADGKTQVFEYITDEGGQSDSSAGSLTLNNTTFAAHVVELGFVTTTTAKTFSGNVALSGSNTTNAIKVASGTGDADYGKEQVFSGVVSGAEILEKKGVGRLNLTGDNTFSGAIKIDDGVLVAGHNNALGAGTKTVTINKGKLEVASGKTTPSDVTIQGGSSRNFIGGDGTVNTVVIGSATNEVDVISPGQGFASSFNLANQQVQRGNGDVDASVGSFTATNLSLVDGGVYDWEMKDFDGTTPGTDWDLLNFTTLVLEPGETFNVNIYGVKADGTAGMPAFSGASADNLLGKTGSFRFLSGSAGNIDWNGAGTGGNGSPWDSHAIKSYFAVNDDNFAYYNYYWGGDWAVNYSGGNFNLAFSAVPEPSTYVMVTGLLMLPGFQFLRRFRKRKNKSEE